MKMIKKIFILTMHTTETDHVDTIDITHMVMNGIIIHIFGITGEIHGDIYHVLSICCIITDFFCTESTL